MKTKRTIKSARLLACCALVILLVCAMAVFAYAESTDTTLSIGRTNLRYDSQTDIIVEVLGEVPEGAVAGIAVWNFEKTANNAADELTLDNVSYFNFTTETEDGVEFYATRGISAKDIGKELTIAPAIRNADGTRELAGEKVTKSLIGYVDEKITKDDLKAYQINLLTSLVVYGEKAAELFNETASMSTVVLTENGYVGGRMLPIDIVDDGTAVLRASAVNADSEYFSHWEDKNGNFVSGQRVLQVSDLTAGLNYYNAVYTEKATSAYGYFADFNQFELGEYKGLVGDLTDTNKTNGFAAFTMPLFKNKDNGDVGFTKWVKFDKTTIGNNAATDSIPATATDSLTIKENYDGTKYLGYKKIAGATGSSATVYTTLFNTERKTEQSTYERFEMDLSVAKNAPNFNGASHKINLKFIGATYGVLELQFSRETKDNVPCLVLTYSTVENNGDAVSYNKIYIPDNGGKDVVTLGFDIDISNGTNGIIKIYVNGVAQELETPAALVRENVGYIILPTTNYGVAVQYNPVSLQIVDYYTNVDWNVYSYGLVDTVK